MHPAVALDLGERLHARRQLVADAADAAILVEVAVVVAGGGAVGERRVLVDGTVDGGAGGQIQPVEILVDAEGAAERRIDRITGEAGLDVRAAGIVGGHQQPHFRGEMGILADIETAVDVTGEVGPIDIGRRRRDRAVDGRRQAVAVAGERAPEIGDQSMAIPVGHREEFRRHHPERHPLRRIEPARIGVVAAAEFDRRLDQKAAGVVADRAEGIIIDLEPLARRLAFDGAGHRRRQRCLVGKLGGRDRQSQRSGRVDRGRCRRGTAGPRRRFRPCLARMGLRLPACAIERIEAGVGSAVGSRNTIGRDLPDPRRRGRVRVAALAVARRIA